MGQEIESSQFTQADMVRFRQQLEDETDILRSYFANGSFRHKEYKAGFELEAWLLDTENQAAPDNEAFLEAVNSPDVVPELATFNFEVNGAPVTLADDAFDSMYNDLLQSWQHCMAVAASRQEKVLMTGILPYLREQDFCLENMSRLSRYEALNRQVLQMRDNKPLHLHIEGRDVIDTWKGDVMLEAATTSFQVHYQIPVEESVRVFNASLLASAPVVAVAANSPYLFGKDLWAETRIPLFEQAVEVGLPDHRRVGFGSGYLKHSMLECFEENLNDYPALLPLINDANPELLTHLKFHNGTIWRWNRPLIDFDSHNQPHLRIEHRVVPAGPTITDCIANAAFYYGLCHGLCLKYDDPSLLVSFGKAHDNFYSCARLGLDAKVSWRDGNDIPVNRLITEELLPLAWSGLQDLQINPVSISRWLGIIEHRTLSGQNGAAWQRQWIRTHGHDMKAMIARYHQHQITETPVHEWPL